MENKYVVLVHDRRDGTYAYRGEGTQTEITKDVRVLVEDKRIPPRRIEVVPVNGEPRTTPKTTANNTGKIFGITLAAVTIGGLIYFGYKKYKKNKKEKEEK